MSTTATPPAHEEQHAEHDAHAEHPAEGGGHGGHGGGGHAHGGHGPHKSHEHPHHGPPPWLISFGDMMTLFLCFFIILVTMAKKQDAGLVARGLGNFVVALESKGMGAALSGAEYLNAVNSFRKNFGLDPITEEEMLEGRADAKNLEEVRRILETALRPYTALPQPAIARFAANSADLDEKARKYLDLIAESLRPGSGQLLILEGHADEPVLAFQRAAAVRDYLIATCTFVNQRVEARAWSREPHFAGGIPATVDARLIQPISKDVN
ncbi:MAG: OmpA family protein [Planctomycetes bacterium]|nr:OmpA family protein [Planctomycetota bacterium]